jgi:hypothetical protein
MSAAGAAVARIFCESLPPGKVVQPPASDARVRTILTSGCLRYRENTPHSALPFLPERFRPNELGTDLARDGARVTPRGGGATEWPFYGRAPRRCIACEVSEPRPVEQDLHPVPDIREPAFAQPIERARDMDPRWPAASAMSRRCSGNGQVEPHAAPPVEGLEHQAADALFGVAAPQQDNRTYQLSRRPGLGGVRSWTVRATAKAHRFAGSVKATPRTAQPSSVRPRNPAGRPSLSSAIASGVTA